MATSSADIGDQLLKMKLTDRTDEAISLQSDDSNDCKNEVTHSVLNHVSFKYSMNFYK